MVARKRTRPDGACAPAAERRIVGRTGGREMSRFKLRDGGIVDRGDVGAGSSLHVPSNTGTSLPNDTGILRPAPPVDCSSGLAASQIRRISSQGASGAVTSGART